MNIYFRFLNFLSANYFSSEIKFLETENKYLQDLVLQKEIKISELENLLEVKQVTKDLDNKKPSIKTQYESKIKPSKYQDKILESLNLNNNPTIEQRSILDEFCTINFIAPEEKPKDCENSNIVNFDNHSNNYDSLSSHGHSSDYSSHNLYSSSHDSSSSYSFDCGSSGDF